MNRRLFAYARLVASGGVLMHLVGVIAVVPGCQTAVNCQTVAAAISDSNVAYLTVMFDEASQRGETEQLAYCLQSAIREHPDESTECLLRALSSDCDRMIAYKLAAGSGDHVSRAVGRFLVLAGMYGLGGGSLCAGQPHTPLAKQVVDRVADQLMDTALIQSRRWRGHAGSDASIRRYSDLAFASFDRLLLGAPRRVADSLGLDRAHSGDPISVASELIAWWKHVREQVEWDERYGAYVMASWLEPE